MKAIVFLDGQIAEGYGNLKYDGVLAFTKEANSSTRINRTNARKMYFAPKVEVHGITPSIKKNRRTGKKVKVQYK